MAIEHCNQIHYQIMTILADGCLGEEYSKCVKTNSTAMPFWFDFGGVSRLSPTTHTLIIQSNYVILIERYGNRSMLIPLDTNHSKRTSFSSHTNINRIL